MNMIKDLIDYVTKLFTWWVVVMPWEQGIRITLGRKQKLLNGGVYLKLPIVHTIFKQESRTRIIQSPIQTLSTKDQHAVTIRCCVGYSIADILKLYNTVSYPDSTIVNIILGKAAEFICNNNLDNCTAKKLQEHIIAGLGSTNHGLVYHSVEVSDFASVKTFRLIQDSSWLNDGIDLKVHS